jgi:esterase/lipase superfamily enzyme
MPRITRSTIQKVLKSSIYCILLPSALIYLVSFNRNKRYIERLKNSHLVAFGRSLGGAVAMSLAHKHPDIIKAVIAENTFLSVGKKSRNHFGAVTILYTYLFGY